MYSHEAKSSIRKEAQNTKHTRGESIFIFSTIYSIITREHIFYVHHSTYIDLPILTLNYLVSENMVSEYRHKM